MNAPEEQLLRDFVAWCQRRSVPSGSELGELKARAERLLPPEPPSNPLDHFTFWDEKYG